MEKTFLTNDELAKIQAMQGEFNNIKLSLGDLEMQKAEMMKRVDGLKKDFAEHEKSLIEKYGDNTVVNIQTGEVTKKQA